MAGPMTDEKFVGLVGLTVARFGCRIIDLDLCRKVVNIDGPSDEAMVECAQALEGSFDRMEAVRDA